MARISSWGHIDLIPDKNIELDLLPTWLHPNDNSILIDFYKHSLRVAWKSKLTEAEQDLLYKCYVQKMKQKDIAKSYGVSRGTISKRLRKTINTLSDYLLFLEKTLMEERLFYLERTDFY